MNGMGGSARTIKMTPDELQACSRTMKTKLVDMENSWAQLKREFDDACSRWEGAAACAYIPGAKAILDKIKADLRANIEGLANDMDKAAVQMRNTDQTLAREINRGGGAPLPGAGATG